MDKTNVLTTKSVFDTKILIPGDAVILIQAPGNIGDDPRKKTCLIKKVSPLSITLMVGKISSNIETFEYEFKEETYPIEAFEGIGRYELELMIPETEISGPAVAN